MFIVVEIDEMVKQRLFLLPFRFSTVSTATKNKPTRNILPCFCFVFDFDFLLSFVL
jgi:hypothetical protein